MDYESKSFKTIETKIYELITEHLLLSCIHPFNTFYDIDAKKTKPLVDAASRILQGRINRYIDLQRDALCEFCVRFDEGVNEALKHPPDN